MRIVSAAEAVRAIPDGATVIFPHGAVEPSTFYAAFEREVDRFHNLAVYSGLSFGEYAFLRRGLGTSFLYFTWQVSARLRRLVEKREVGFVPMRYGEIHRLVSRAGPIRPQVVVTQVSPPGANGTVSLGISTGLHRGWIEDAELVIAEIHPDMPRTAGESEIAAARIGLAVEASTPLLEYRTPAGGERERRIVDLALGLVPDGASVQLGVGAIPDRVLERLGEKRDVNVFSGLVTQGLVRYVETARHTPSIVTGEIAGDRGLYDFCGRTPLVHMATTRTTHDVCALARIPRFVSINSAIEVDLHGQANGETIGDVQVSGVGGSLDYVEGAALSEGGVSILAFPSTTDDGQRSRIVARLGGPIVTTPRYCVDWVVTEYGAVRLKGKDLRARAEALVAIAHPDFRGELAASLR